MASSLSNLVDNLAKEIYKVKYKYQQDNKKCQTCEIKYRNRDSCLEYRNFKHDLVLRKCLCCNTNYPKILDEKLKNRLANTCKFSNHGFNEFVLLLLKDVYPYEYTDDYKRKNNFTVT